MGNLWSSEAMFIAKVIHAFPLYVIISVWGLIVRHS